MDIIHCKMKCFVSQLNGMLCPDSIGSTLYDVSDSEIAVIRDWKERSFPDVKLQ